MAGTVHPLYAGGAALKRQMRKFTGDGRAWTLQQTKLHRPGRNVGFIRQGINRAAPLPQECGIPLQCPGAPPETRRPQTVCQIKFTLAVHNACRNVSASSSVVSAIGFAFMLLACVDFWTSPAMCSDLMP